VIVVNAIIEATEADIAALKEAIAVMEAKSRAEAGCLDYTFSVELNRPGVLRVTEKWESLEALGEHFKQPHMADFQAAMAEYSGIAVTANFYEVRDVDVSLS
jgi:quinol monooxygenase YgiN